MGRKMANINPSQLFEKIRMRYLSFVLTTVCRKNEVIYKELREIFLKNELLWRNLILQATAKYQTGDLKQLNDLNYEKKFIEFVSEKVPMPYNHQISAWINITQGRNCVVATGTGSGKTEAFVFPILDYCIKNMHKGVQAIIIYPLKALAKDQGDRIGQYLDRINEIFSKNIKYGIFDYDTGKRESSKYKSEINSREEMYKTPPNILITNYVMLERILLNPEYLPILKNSGIKFIVLDEIHYYRGAQGIDVSLLMRRLQFHLFEHQDISNIQYVGTSATLGYPHSEEVNSFLFRLFNTAFRKDSIISPTFSEMYKKDELFEPHFLSEIKNLGGFSDKNIRAHSFFCAPPPLYRCQMCSKIHIIKEEKCSNCESKLLSEIVTCRQCGEEYFKFEFAELSGQIDSDITFDTLDISGCLNHFNNKENSEKGGEIILTKKQFKENNIKIKLCTNCLKLYPEMTLQCSECEGGGKLVEFFGPQKKDKIVVLNQQSNNRYCPACDFEESRQDLIISVSKISDENCSHIVFDEYFMSLPEQRRKLLIFTDNAQRTSKFAREIEETHLKNIARAELQKIIEKLERPTYLPNVIFNVLDNIKRKTTINEYLELNLKKELYEELLSTGKKVGSLANRGIFRLQVFNLEKFSKENQEKIVKAFEVFQKQNQLLTYYEIINKEDINSGHTFLETKKLIEQIYRSINHLQKKRLDNVDFSEVKKIIGLLRDNGLLNESDGKYFFKEEFIEICKNKVYSFEKNYYDEWKEIDNIPMLRSKIDTARITAEERSQTEQDFKDNKSNVNFLVATPTLELGIDIGDLDVVGLLYSPPSPAHYIQRIGRAGRGDQSSIAVTYLSKRTLDSMYFYEPKELVQGQINPPYFTLELEIPIKKALFSIFFYYILHKTNFRKEKEGIAWRNVSTWENYFNNIKENWRSYNKEFQTFLNGYLRLSNIKINTNNLIEEWSEKLEDFIRLQKSIRSKEYRQSLDIFNYFQQAGLLPDYAFGRGDGIVLVNGIAPIIGFSLREICPPSTLDHNKSRFNCHKIDMYPADKIKTIAENFYQCSNCQEVIYLKDKHVNCPLCNGSLEFQNRQIIEPKVIRAKRSTFSLIQKRVNWSYHAIDLPKNIEFKNKFVSNPFICDIGMFFESVSEDGQFKDYFLCGKCGDVYSKDLKRSNYDNHVHIQTNKTIGTKFRTRGIILDLSSLKDVDFITLINALISAITIEAGCEDGEIRGMILQNTPKLILFDNVEGGVGFVDALSNRFKEVIRKAKKLCEGPCCKSGCRRCIGSYWRQKDLDYLRKNEIIPILDQIVS